jgi:hypothetical protein
MGYPRWVTSANGVLKYDFIKLPAALLPRDISLFAGLKISILISPGYLSLRTFFPTPKLQQKIYRTPTLKVSQNQSTSFD